MGEWRVIIRLGWILCALKCLPRVCMYVCRKGIFYIKLLSDLAGYCVFVYLPVFALIFFLHENNAIQKVFLFLYFGIIFPTFCPKFKLIYKHVTET